MHNLERPCGTQDAADAFEYLGTDITLEIISWLDNGSLVELLKSVPRLKKETIILTDHDLPLTHFNISGIKRRFIPSTTFPRYVFDASTFYNSLYDRESIRLIEIVTVDIDHAFLPGNIWSGQRTRLINKTTFIFINPCTSDHPVLDSDLPNVVNKFSTIKMVIGTPSLFANESFEVYENSVFDSDCPFPNLGLVPGYTLGLSHEAFYLSHHMETLKTLRIESSSSCIGISLPKLKQLSIIFSTAVNEIPVVDDVSAPELTHLVIHFNNKVPVMKNISVGQKLLKSHHANPITDCWEELESKVGVLELAHIPSLQVNRDLFSPRMSGYEDQSVYDSIDMAFTKAFLVQRYIGVPDFIVRRLDLTEVGILRWHLSCPFDSISYTLNMPRLNQLMIHLSGSNTKIPVLNCPNLESLGVIVLAHNVDISSLWHSSVIKLTRFELHQTISLSKSKTELDRTITVSEGDWSSFVNNNGGELTHITLKGFEMSFLTNCLITKHASRPEGNNTANRYYSTTLCPIIPDGSRVFECKISIAATPVGDEDSPKAAGNYIKVNPIFENEWDKGNVRLSLTGLDESSPHVFKIETSVSNWLSVSVDGNELKMDLSENDQIDDYRLEYPKHNFRTLAHIWKAEVWERFISYAPREVLYLYRRVCLDDLPYRHGLVCPDLTYKQSVW